MSGEQIVYLAHNAKDTGISTKFQSSLLKNRWKYSNTLNYEKQSFKAVQTSNKYRPQEKC